MSAKGVIFSIEDFAINDGPGIRTTVFFKGCPLCCVWCHNPEGISFKPQVITTKEGQTICGSVISASELATRLLKDKYIFLMNEGGVTITGGEPLAQFDFLIELMSLIHPIHRAIETSGHAPSEVFREVLKFTDLILFDVKHMNAFIHKQYTGIGNESILKNLACLCASDKPFIVRIPLIPGVNDTLSNMQATCEFIKDARSLVRVELLRYHKTAGAKYAMTGKTFAPPFDPEAEVMIHNVFEDNNIKTLIL